MLKTKEVRWLDGELDLGCFVVVGKRVEWEERCWRKMVDGTNPSRLLLLPPAAVEVEKEEEVVGEEERSYDDPTRRRKKLLLLVEKEEEDRIDSRDLPDLRDDWEGVVVVGKDL